MKPLFQLLSVVSLITVIQSCAEPPRYCEVHNHEITNKDVQIAYGLMPMVYDYKLSFEFMSARDTLFPNEFLRNYVEGGCIVGTEDELEVSECAACNQAYKDWMASNDSLIQYWEKLPDSVASRVYIEADTKYDAWLGNRRERELTPEDIVQH